MKKFIKLSLIFVFVLMMSFFFVGCKKEGKKENYSRVTVDINPSIELILDEENNVVSVTALNDEGNIIIVGESIVGRSIDDALQIIIHVSTRTGYLVQGEVEASENEVKISVSGDEKAQEELYNHIKSEVEVYLNSVNVQGIISKKEALEKQALIQLVQQIDPSLSNEELNSMSEQELLKILKLERIERAEIYSQELEKLYNEAKVYEIKFAERVETQKVINGLDTQYLLLKSTYSALVKSFGESLNSLEEAKYNYLVSPESEYQKAYQRLFDAKEELLLQKNKVAELAEGSEKEAAKLILEQKEKAYTHALESMDAIYEFACEQFDKLLGILREFEAQLIEFETKLPSEIKTILNEKAQEIETICNEKKSNFFNEFEKEYADEINYYKELAQARKDELTNENK